MPGCDNKSGGPVFKETRVIKGPGHRIKLDVRRVWSCPQCGRRMKTAGSVVSQRCGCTQGGVWMQMVEQQRPQRPSPTVVIPHAVEAEDLADAPLDDEATWDSSDELSSDDDASGGA